MEREDKVKQMKTYATWLGSLGLSALLIFPVGAATKDTGAAASVGKSPRPEAGELPRGWHPFLGLGVGYTPYQSQANVEGVPSSFKLLGSYYFKREGRGVADAVFDLGGGLADQQFSQSAIGSRVTTSGVLEAAARYQWASRWQAGVVLNDFLNQGSAYRASQGDAHFAGVQALKEFDLGARWLARGGARLMTEINNTGPSVNMFLAELQLGWNPPAPTAPVAPVAAKTAKTATTATTVQAPRPAVPPPLESREPEEVERVRSGSILSSLFYAQRSPDGEKLTTFDLSRADISNADRAYLQKLARVLRDNSDLYGRVVVHGYADVSGTEEFNRRLSQARAERVRKELAKSSGLPESRFASVGNGTAGSKGILKTDRRVELEFVEVENTDALKKALSSIE